MRRAFSLFFMLLPSLALPTGCSDDSGGSSNGVVTGTPIPEQDFAATFASTVCGAYAGCCQAGSFPFEQTKCETEFREELSKDLEKFKQAGVVYDAQSAGNCAATYRSLISTCKIGVDDAPIKLACEGVFHGTKTAGEACSYSDQCVNGLRCRPETDGGETRCTAPKGPIAAGEKCVVSTKDGSSSYYEDCSEGYYCDGVANQCVASKTEGQSCQAGLCQESLYCPYTEESPTCRRRAALGEACHDEFSSVPTSGPPPCAADLRCDETTKTCSPRERPFTADTCKGGIDL